LAGNLTFNPLTDTIKNDKGEDVKLKTPTGNELPEHGYLKGEDGFVAPAFDGAIVDVIIDPASTRLQKLEAFAAPNLDKDFEELPVLIKVKGKCTTDHISMAGPWLKYRGHLDNISNNMFIGAINFFNDKANHVKNQLTKAYEEVPKVARDYKANGYGMGYYRRRKLR
jgi:aconitate hydratase